MYVHTISNQNIFGRWHAALSMSVLQTSGKHNRDMPDRSRGHSFLIHHEPINVVAISKGSNSKPSAVSLPHISALDSLDCPCPFGVLQEGGISGRARGGSSAFSYPYQNDGLRSPAPTHSRPQILDDGL